MVFGDSDCHCKCCKLYTVPASHRLLVVMSDFKLQSSSNVLLESDNPDSVHLPCFQKVQVFTRGVMRGTKVLTLGVGMSFHGFMSYPHKLHMLVSVEDTHMRVHACDTDMQPLVHVLAHAHYFFAHKMADHSKPYRIRSSRCSIPATEPFQPLIKLILITR